MELNIKYRNWSALKDYEQNQKIHDKLWDNILQHIIAKELIYLRDIGLFLREKTL